MTSAMIDGVMVKVGSKVIVRDWLCFSGKITAIHAKNRVEVDVGGTVLRLTRAHGARGEGHAWKKSYGGYVGLDFSNDHARAKEINDAIESSETWMCM